MVKTSKRLKILIVDDEPDTVSFLSTFLQDIGHETCSAADGKEGMEVLLHEQPDLLLMDLKMPTRTGMQLYRELQTQERFRQLPVIILTGVAEFHIFGGECRALPEPAARLDKPVDLKALQAAIDKAVA